MSLTGLVFDVWDRLSHSPAQRPLCIRIRDDHVESPVVGAPILKDEHYFQVRVNELFLSDRRQWWREIDPMVFFVTEFTYDKHEETIPFVVGPQIMKKLGQDAPRQMVFSNTRVAGLHPYRGGALSLTAVLLSVERSNYAKTLLEFIERAGTLLDFGTAFSTYTKLAGLVVSGVDALLGAGGVEPLLGLRRSFDPSADDSLVGSYFALIEGGDETIDEEQLWVRDDRLFIGDSTAEAAPFRMGDFVLYSVAPTQTRPDERLLPFYPLFERVKAQAMSTSADDWQRAKGDMASLWQTLVLSPDLTERQATALASAYRDEMKRLHEQAVEYGTLGGERSRDDQLRGAVEVLEL